jgi:hypothetical protein
MVPSSRRRTAVKFVFRILSLRVLSHISMLCLAMSRIDSAFPQIGGGNALNANDAIVKYKWSDSPSPRLTRISGTSTPPACAEAVSRRVPYGIAGADIVPFFSGNTYSFGCFVYGKVPVDLYNSFADGTGVASASTTKPVGTGVMVLCRSPPDGVGLSLQLGCGNECELLQKKRFPDLPFSRAHFCQALPLATLQDFESSDAIHPYFLHKVGWSSAFLVASVVGVPCAIMALSRLSAISLFLVTYLAWVAGSFEYRSQFSQPPMNSKKMHLQACVTRIKWLAMALIILTSALCAKGHSAVRVTPHPSASTKFSQPFHSSIILVLLRLQGLQNAGDSIKMAK